MINPMKKEKSEKSQDETRVRNKSGFLNKKPIKEKSVKADAIKEVRIVDDAKWW